MKLWKKVTLGTVALLLLALALFLVPTLWGKPWSINHFYARVFLEFMLDRPQLLSQMRILEQFGFELHNDDLDDYSVAATLRRQERLEENLRMLRRYDPGTGEDRLSHEVLSWFLQDLVDGSPWVFHDYPVNQNAGFQSALPDFLVTTHHLGDAGDARDYNRRLARIGVAVDQMIDALRYRERRGIMPPRFVIVRVLEQMRELIAPPAAESVLVKHLAESLAALDDIDAAERAERVAEATRLVEQVVYPAYRRLIDHHAALEPQASTDDGIWKLPDGEACYAHRLRSFTTTDMSAEEIHQIGLREVARIRGEMQAILTELGLPAEDFAAAMEALNADPRLSFPDTEEARREILERYRRIIAEVDGGVDAFLARRPTAKVTVEPVPEFMQATAPAAYCYPPAMDGSRPGVFFVNLRQPTDIRRFDMRTLAYHEAIPGHHLQHAVAMELVGLPFFRRVVPFTAYSEGWALYAEQLAAELGYEADPYDRLGFLTAQIFRAVRLVVDTGIHHQRWTREQAIDYMAANTGMPESEVIAEVERYIVDPGQACAYMVGFLELMRLRDEARAALGDEFDLREFHRVVLGQGALPLELLRDVVEQWYGEAREQRRALPSAAQ